ncbi:repeat protein [Moumouvirus goulette]|uniref:Repeat protein n=1 Tax=Moumouvirus goulette TaxID=1247379 RepID=M1NM47_9VIRU|nr:repeat protein [Moumouvirus goulette]AGF85095.1 repeat protein [Moumouvirus goulette]
MKKHQKLINSLIYSTDEDIKLLNIFSYRYYVGSTIKFNKIYTTNDFNSLNDEDQKMCLKYLVASNNYDKLYEIINNSSVDIFFEDNILFYISLYNSSIYNTQSSYNLIKLFIDEGFNVSSNDNMAIKLGANSEYSVLELLIENGSDVNVSNNMPIRKCINCGCLRKIKLLVDNGADLHCCGEKIFKISCIRDFDDIMDYCIDSGADINIDNGISLKIAINQGCYKITRKLINNGANISFIDKYDIFFLIKHMYFDIIDLLLENGIDFSMVNGLCNDLINEDKKSKKYYKTISSLLENEVSSSSIIRIINHKDN